VYDGLPDFVSATTSHQSHVLGVFCSVDTKYPVTVEAKSGEIKVSEDPTHIYSAVLKHLAMTSDFHIPLPSIVPFTHSETSFTHGSRFFGDDLIFSSLQVSS
jgi:hypothetical protein